MASIAARWQGRAEGSEGRPVTARGAVAAAAASAERLPPAPPPRPPGGVLSLAGFALLAKDPKAFDAAIAEAKKAAAASSL
jgi:hypothetical protein